MSGTERGWTETRDGKQKNANALQDPKKNVDREHIVLTKSQRNSLYSFTHDIRSDSCIKLEDLS